MKYQIVNMLGFSVSFAVLFASAEFLHHFIKVEVEKTRKLVHLGSGMITMLFPLFFHSITEVAVLSIAFLGLLAISKRFNMLSSINAVARKTTGSYWFPISVILCFAAQIHFDDLAFFYMPILTLTLADPVACLVGRRLPLHIFNFKESQKSIGGSLAFFLVSFGLSLIFIGDEFQSGLATHFMIASAATLAEFVGGKGYDNVTIPASCIAMLYFLQTQILIYA